MDMAKLEIISKVRVVPNGYDKHSSFGNFEKGCYHRVRHESIYNKSKMTFGIFIPSSYENNCFRNIPALFWLSGMTCDDTNFAMKAGQKAFQAAERHNMAIIMPDTSPRGPNVPDTDVYHMGTGASFYINATASPYDEHYQMYDYITKELPSIIEKSFNIGKNGLKSICGHNMGGHGALVIALRQGNSSWKSVSALAPICNPTKCSFGKTAFDNYFIFAEEGKMNDATCLLEALVDHPAPFDDILIDQGTVDPFITAADKSGQKLTLNKREGFDHSYFFVANFIEDHVNFHADRLNAKDSFSYSCW